MGEFVQELLDHVRRTSGRLAEAQAAGDDYSETVLQGELEGLQRLAEEHDVVLSLPESPPAAGETAASAVAPEVVDLDGESRPVSPA